MGNKIDFTNGSITSTATEQDLFSVVGDKYYATWIFTHNMLSGDTISVRVYIKDPNGAQLRKYADEPITGVQVSTAWYIHLVPASEYKVSIIRTAGTDRAYTWLRAEI
jgi:hypothetical protein